MISWLFAVAMLFYLGHPLAVSALLFLEAYIITPIAFFFSYGKMTYKMCVITQVGCTVLGLIIYLVFR